MGVQEKAKYTLCSWQDNLADSISSFTDQLNTVSFDTLTQL